MGSVGSELFWLSFLTDDFACGFENLAKVFRHHCAHDGFHKRSHSLLKRSQPILELRPARG